MVRTPCFHCCGLGSIPGLGTEIPQAVWHGQKRKRDDLGSVVFIETLVASWVGSLEPEGKTRRVSLRYLST